MNFKEFFNRKPKNVYIVNDKQIKKLAPEIITECISALEEGQILDILTPLVTQAYTSTLSTCVDKNNYPTYINQIQTINRMFNNRTDYGAEILRALIKIRVSFIGGEGVSVKAKTKKIEDCVTKFLEYNKMLEGSGLLKILTLQEMEGKSLLQLKPIKKKDKWENIKVIKYSYYVTPYEVKENGLDKDEYESVKISTNKLSKDTILKLKSTKSGQNDINLNSDEFVFIKVGGSPDRVNNTPPLIANVLTDIENFSRCKYDMRANNHLYGRITPVFLVEDIGQAKSLQNKINLIDSVIGKSYVGVAKQVFYLEPSGKAQEVLAKEMIDLLRIIGTNMGIPIHYLSYPDLLSNRATAENLLEMINAATNQERLINEEAFTELVRKAMIIGVEKGIEGFVNESDNFEIKLNFATLALLKQIAEVWMPLFMEEIVSKKSLMSRLPGINVNKELALLKKEKEEKIDNMNKAFGGEAKGLPKEEEEDGSEEASSEPKGT